MAFSKTKRHEIYNKYNGRCAYCGRKMTYKDMQVDHLQAKSRGGSNDISNLMPACRACNHYKRAHTLEVFRQYIQEIPLKLKNNYIYKIGLLYGNIIENDIPIEFYFEKIERQKSQNKNRKEK